jgi:hypothetical protein
VGGQRQALFFRKMSLSRESEPRRAARVEGLDVRML